LSGGKEIVIGESIWTAGTDELTVEVRLGRDAEPYL